MTFSSDCQSFEDFIEGIKLESQNSGRNQTKTLIVRWLKEENQIKYKILTSNIEENLDFPENEVDWDATQNIDPDIIRRETILSAWNNLRDCIASASTREIDNDNESWKNIFDSLIANSKVFAEAFIPQSIRENIRNFDFGTLLTIDTNECTIPWEMIYDSDLNCFWGNNFLIAHIPLCIESENNLPIAHLSYRNTTISNQENLTIRNIVGYGISPKTRSDARILFDFLPAQDNFDVESIESTTPSSLSTLTKSLEINILNITCKGRHRTESADPSQIVCRYYLQIHETSETSQNLTLERIQELNLNNCNIVFANACSSVIPILTVNDFRNFGWEFYRNGAKVYIGTLGEIPEKYMCEFTSIFYKALINGEPATISSAYTTAKSHLIKKHPFALFYRIYGNPNFQVI
ncbi:MAG: CHAT domain-containing protein [Cyanobacteria bacterium P01_A01_bin.40]